ncbi:PREDICTED: uncharacterized protein LOC106815662 [Priapulus caudatus]|uniref:Uncharacterized protein LOC106815662 n=1 Tax=Priapulus caudatus TaxID=37621 RepID=A0ABM1ETX4_PRICU|nr:PREDICTED: uncharacterized protein LOC106815662 [Priapulus caudatus]
MGQESKAICFAIFAAVLCLPHSTSSSRNPWQKPGCHRVGFERTVTIPSCMPFTLATNGCRGYCTSFAVPSPQEVVAVNPTHAVTSYANCCNIGDSREVAVKVLCLDKVRTVTFKSAETCACSLCTKH